MEKKSIDDGGIILGEDITNVRRGIAFLSIVIIYFFYCYNFMVGSFIRPTMVRSIAEGGFGFELSQASAIFAIMSFATIPGTLIFGHLTTKIGKKYTLVCLGFLIGIMTYLPLISPTSFWFWRLARFSTGLALGGVFGTAVPLVTEMFRAKYRGKLAAILTSLFSLALMFAGWLYGVMGDANWNLLMVTAALPPIVGGVAVLLFVPNDRQLTLDRQRKSIEEKGVRISYLSMYRGKYLFIGIGVIILSGLNFSAYSGFFNNATTYLRDTIELNEVTVGTMVSLQGFGQLIGYNMWGFISDKFGRKYPAIGMALCAVFVFIYTRLGTDNVTVFMIISTLLGLCIGFSGAWGAYYTELFPKRFSGLAPGISFNGGRIISTFALPLIASVGATSLGMVGIFFIVIGIFILGSVVWIFLPETLNRVREE